LHVDTCRQKWQSVGMAKEPISPVIIAELELTHQRLTSVLAEIASFVDWSKKLPTDTKLWMFRKESLSEGLRRLEATLPEFKRTMHSYVIGQPLGPSSTKTRGSKKTLEEHKKTLDAKRSKKKT
jgi:hypothetical protein